MALARRTILASGLACLARPALAQGNRTLRYGLDGDAAVLDPVWATGALTRNHGFLVFDTLYGQTADFAFEPQMLAGHVVEQDGLVWLLTLRDGLRFHDGEPVRGRDVVASIRRFGARDAFGRSLMAATDELSAPDDRTIRFRLSRPFPLLPAVLGKTGPNMPCIMPERLALTDPSRQVTEMVGSGPFRFKADERVPGALLAYERFAGYVPRPDGSATFTAGPKRAWFDRVEWRIMPDPSIAASALMNGEIDWWAAVAPDLQPVLARNKDIKTEVLDTGGALACLRFNTLFPPFDKPAVRRALLGAVNQAEVMTAVAGDDLTLWRDRVGVFSPGTPNASTEGTEALVGPRDYDRVRRDLADAGYRGETVVMLDAVNYATYHPMALVMADAFTRCGVKVDLVSMDWATLVQRRASRQPPAQGGWNAFLTYFNSTNNFDPAAQIGLRGDGDQGWYGWPKAPRLEELRESWFRAPDAADRQRVCLEIQRQFFIDVPYLPLGALYEKTGTRRLKGVRTGFPQFYDVQPV